MVILVDNFTALIAVESSCHSVDSSGPQLSLLILIISSWIIDLILFSCSLVNGLFFILSSFTFF